MTLPFPPRGRAALLAAAAAAGATLLSLPASAAATTGADVDIDIRGGQSLSEVVCGNVATAEALADQRGILLQRSNCRAAATGGSATLENVKITINQAAMRASADARRLAAAALDSRAPVAVDTCRHLPGVSPRQRNVCSARADGGHVIISDGTFVVHHADGSRTVTQRPTLVMPGETGTATAECSNVDSRVFDQRDDCNTQGDGGSLELRNVDVVDSTPGGISRQNINVTVKGGVGKANTFCFNVEDTAGRIVQINVCRSQGTGGDVYLRNVQIDTFTG